GEAVKDATLSPCSSLSSITFPRRHVASHGMGNRITIATSPNTCGTSSWSGLRILQRRVHDWIPQSPERDPTLYRVSTPRPLSQSVLGPLWLGKQGCSTLGFFQGI